MYADTLSYMVQHYMDMVRGDDLAMYDDKSGKFLLQYRPTGLGLFSHGLNPNTGGRLLT